MMLLSRVRAVVKRSVPFIHRLQSTAAVQSPSRPSYFHHVGREPLVYRTVGQQLARAASLFGDREAIVAVEQRQRLTYAQVLERADRLAAAFAVLGLRRGDRIGIWSPNTADWFVTMMGAARAGLVSVALNPAYQPPEIAFCLQKVGTRAIYAPAAHRKQQYYEMLAGIVPELAASDSRNISSQRFPHLQTVIIDSDQQHAGAYSFDDLLRLATAEQVRQVAEQQALIDPDAPCNIQFTSGTTGTPKAAVLSHHNFVNNGTFIGVRSEMRDRPQRICVQVPLFHAFGVVITVMAALAHGATMVLPSRGYDPEASLRAIADERCTLIHGTPTMFVDLIAKQRQLHLDVESAELATTGGSPCSPQLFREIRDVLGLRKVQTVFGMTETTASSFFSLADESEQQVCETVGHLQDHLEAKVVDADGRTVPMGQPGELLVRGYSTMLGYYGDAEKTREVLDADKWLRTGDQFSLSEDGYGRIVGRLKEMIIRGGENIYPKEIEDFLNGMPQIRECHVFGVPDERLGEDVAVAVRLQDDHSAAGLTRDDLVRFCAGRLSHFKVPRYVRVVNEFPKTASGKIQKFILRDRFVAERA